MSRAPNGFGSLTYTMRGGKKYWTGRITLGTDANGNQIRRSFSGYKKTEVMEQMKDALVRSAGTISGTVENGNQRFSDLIKRWLFNVKILDVKSASLSRYDTIIRLRIDPYPYSNVKVRDINVLNLQNYINQLAEDEWSYTTIKDTLSLIKSFLNYTVAIGIHPSNPAVHVQVPKQHDLKNKEKKVYRIFSQEEQDEILNALDLTLPVDQMLYLDFFTGLRRNELRGLQWQDYKDGILHIRRQLGRDYSFSKDGTRTLNKDNVQTLKTESSKRTLPLPILAKRLLDEIYPKAMEKHLRIGKPFTKEAFIFSDDLCQPIEEKRPNRRLQVICKNIGIEPRPLHSIRHSYATRLFEQGVDIKTVQDLMGHAEYQTTINIYTHVMPKQKEIAISAFDKLYNVK